MLQQLCTCAFVQDCDAFAYTIDSAVSIVASPVLSSGVLDDRRIAR